MNSGYEVDYERGQRARLGKFTAGNVRVVNELKDTQETTEAGVKLPQHVTSEDESGLILTH